MLTVSNIILGRQNEKMRIKKSYAVKSKDDANSVRKIESRQSERALQPKVTAVIVSHNGVHWINDCIKSILESDYANLEVVLVDNASEDSTVNVASNWDKDIAIVPLNRNIGFGKAANVGIEYALASNAEYVLVLNQDLRLASGCVTHLVKACIANNQIGVACSYQFNYDGDRIDPSFGNVLKQLEANAEDLGKGKNRQMSYEVESIVGACILLRTEVIKLVGGFDPIYFMYHEEEDLVRRVRYHGFEVHVVPESQVFHWHAHLHPRQMRLKVKIAATYGYYIFVLKNPFKQLSDNIRELIKKMGDWVRSGRDANARCRRALMGVFVVMVMVVLMSRIIRSRKKDMSKGLSI